MDQSFEDSKRFKRSGKKRPPSQQQQQENSATGSVSAHQTANLQPSGSLASINNSSMLSAIQTSAATASQVAGSFLTSQIGDRGISQNPQKLAESLNNDGNSSSVNMIVHSELIEYVNKLEYLVVSTRQKLLRERKAYSQIISSLALYFDAKGIRSQQIEEYVNSVVDQLKINKEESELDVEQLDWMCFLNDKKQESLQSLKRQSELQDNQGTISQSNISAIQLGTLNSQGIPNGTNTLNGNTANLINLNSSTLQSLYLSNSKFPQTSLTSQTVGQLSATSGNIIRLPMNNNSNNNNGGGDDKKGQVSSQSQHLQKLKNKGGVNPLSSSSQSSNKNVSSTQNNNTSNNNNYGQVQGSIQIDIDSEEPKNKKKKKPNPSSSSGGSSYIDTSGITNQAAQQYMINQQYLNYLPQQNDQQKLQLHQQFLQAQQLNQISPPNKLNEQLIQQYLINLQSQQNAQ